MKFLKLDICASEISRNKEATKKITNKKINWLEIYQEIWNNRKFLLSGKHHKILKIYYYIRHEKSRSFLKYLKFVEMGVNCFSRANLSFQPRHDSVYSSRLIAKIDKNLFASLSSVHAYVTVSRDQFVFRFTELLTLFHVHEFWLFERNKKIRYTNLADYCFLLS